LAEWRGYEPISVLQLEYSLAERNIENEHITMGKDLGMGIMAWSPLASGLLSGKYKPSKGEVEGEGRLAQLSGSGNPAFEKFTEKNWQIVSKLEEVDNAINQPMASVAINWVANRPGVANVILGATKVHQLEETLKALDFEIPVELVAQLDEISSFTPPFPYSFFTPGMQSMITGGAIVGDKPIHYTRSVFIEAQPVGVE